jgi:type I restriction enzyme M protein
MAPISGFEAQRFLVADKLRKSLEPSDYKRVALGLPVVVMRWRSTSG